MGGTGFGIRKVGYLQAITCSPKSEVSYGLKPWNSILYAQFLYIVLCNHAFFSVVRALEKTHAANKPWLLRLACVDWRAELCSHPLRVLGRLMFIFSVTVLLNRDYTPALQCCTVRNCRILFWTAPGRLHFRAREQARTRRKPALKLP